MPDPDELARRYACTAAEQMRLHRTWLTDQVAAGLDIEGLLAEQASSPRCATIKVVVLAQKVPGVGKVRARRSMGQLGIDEGARWGELSPDLLRQLWSVMAEAATHPL